MSLLEKIKGLFGKAALPEETQLLLSGVEDVKELLKGLDEIVTRNEVEARDIGREVDKLSSMETSQKARVQSGEMSTREKTNVLREIKRLRRRMTSLEKRHRIHQDNIDLHLGLFDRITEMEAMELKKVTQGQIEEIAADYDEKLEKHKDIVATALAAHGMEGMYEDSAERAELAALEREILAEAGIDETEPEVDEPEPEIDEPEVVEPEPVIDEPEVEEPTEPVDPARASIDEELARLEDVHEVERDERALELE